MNKLFTTLTTLILTFFGAIFISASSFAQEIIPNADFEQWAGGEPDSWNTSNMMVLFTQFTTVNRETSNPQSGTSCARLQTVTQNVFPIGSVSIPGILTLGVLNIDYANQTASLTGGTPFTGIPASLKGFFKYLPTTMDSCFMGFGLYKWNNGTRDTIGYTYKAIGGNTPDWTPFEVSLNFMISEAPDTMNVAFLSSNAYDGLPHGGTKLWVDNLSLTYGTVSIDGITFPHEFKLYADGQKRLLIIHPNLNQQEIVKMEIYDMAGQLRIYQSSAMQNSDLTLNIGELASGNYVFRANIQGEKPFARKFTILN
jgi:hypothetical protein